MYAAVAPFGLLLLSSLWQYPAVLEEVVKWGILRYGVSSIEYRVWTQGLLVGAVFGLSEAVLFSMNSWSGGQWGAMVMRLLLTVPMHALTGVIIVWGMKNKIGAVGLMVAMGVHWAFNIAVRH